VWPSVAPHRTVTYRLVDWWILGNGLMVEGC